ncbi:MAG: flavin reductase family protein [Methylococcaceae bacterium]
MSITDSEFKQALSLWASGVSVVTTQSASGGLQGMTVTAFSSVSMQPPQVLVCLNTAADTVSGIEDSGVFAVNILNRSQEATSNQFAGGSSQAQRFADNDWQAADNGAPLLTESLVSLACRVVEKVRAGSHWIVIGEIEQSICREGAPLLYYRGAYRAVAE